MNCFNCEVKIAFEMCLNQMSQNRASSTDINMLKKLAIEYYQMLLHSIGAYKPKQNNFDFESAVEILMKEDKKKIVKRRFDRMNNAKESMADTKYQDIPENKDICVSGFKHIKTDELDNSTLIGCE